MTSPSRLPGGLTCAQVLEQLSDYLDGVLPTEVTSSIEDHLGECPDCERFGARFSTLVALLRTPPKDDSVESIERLLQRWDVGDR